MNTTANGVYNAGQFKKEKIMIKIKIKDKTIQFNPNTLMELRNFECKKKEIQLEPPKKFGHICLNITSKCNLNCVYCFSNQYVRKNKDMTWEIAKKAIEKFMWEKQVSIGFFGGEPLLNWNLIYKVVTTYPQGNYGVTSNLTNLQKNMAEFMEKHKFSYIISIDGDEKTHNKSRPGKNINSFQKTIQNLHMLRKIRGSVLPATLRSTWDNAGEKVRLLDRIKFLNTFVEKEVVVHVSVEPATGTLSFKKLTKEDTAYYQEQYYEVAEYFLNYFRKNNKFPRFHHFNYPIERILLIPNMLKKNECGAGKGYIDISTEGKVYACHREDTEPIGNIEDGIDTEIQKKWLKNTYEEKEICKKCWAKNFCGGGCRVNAIIETGNILSPSKIECWFHKARLKAVFWLWNELTEIEKNILKTSIQAKRKRKCKT